MIKSESSVVVSQIAFKAEVMVNDEFIIVMKELNKHSKEKVKDYYDWIESQP